MSNLIQKLKEIPDFRRPQGRIYSLWQVLLIVIMATMSGYFGERAKGDFVDRNEEQLLSFFKPKSNKLPSYQLIDYVLDKIGFDELILIFLDWAKSLKVDIQDSDLEKEWVHLDGKAIAGTIKNCSSKEQEFINIVSAFSSKRRKVLGFNLVENNKESEIPKIQELIKLLDLQDVVFTADALHCQKETTKVIVETKNDYVLQVKGNQRKLQNQLKKNANQRQTSP